MPRPFTPKVVTANDLLDGDVIYWTAQAVWVRTLKEASLFETQETADAALALAGADGMVVGAYLADAAAGADGINIQILIRALCASASANLKAKWRAVLMARSQKKNSARCA